MTLHSRRELEVTRQKRQELELLYAKTASDTTQNAYARGLTLRSLRRTANELKEEIVRFEAHSNSTTADN